MVSTAVLVTAVLASYAVIITLVLALMRQFGESMDARFATMAARFDGVDARLDRVEARLDHQGEQTAGLRAAVAGIDGRISTLGSRS